MSDILPSELIEPSKDEIFYESYWEAKKNPAKFKYFIEKLEEKELINKTLFIPEIPASVPEILPEEWFFGSDKKNTIVIRKHPNLTPVFMHQHEFLELFFILDGQSSQVINGFHFDMKQGDLCIIPPNTKHSLSVFDNSKVLNILIRQTTFEQTFHNFLCSNNILSGFILNNMYSTKASDYLIFHTADQQNIKKLVLEMFKESRITDQFSQNVLQLMLQQLFIELLRKPNQNYELPPNVNRENLIRFDIIRYIQDSYQEISLESLADNFHFTPQYASRLIKQLTGRSFSEILLHIRMQQACSLLQNTKIPIGDIASEIGYLNPEHFIRIFKRQYNMTPGEYRASFKTEYP